MCAAGRRGGGRKEERARPEEKSGGGAVKGKRCNRQRGRSEEEKSGRGCGWKEVECGRKVMSRPEDSGSAAGR